LYGPRKLGRASRNNSGGHPASSGLSDASLDDPLDVVERKIIALMQIVPRTDKDLCGGAAII
jgi:hypothetical protein